MAEDVSTGAMVFTTEHEKNNRHDWGGWDGSQHFDIRQHPTQPDTLVFWYAETNGHSGGRFVSKLNFAEAMREWLANEAAPVTRITTLTPAQANVLRWVSKDDSNPLGACEGADLHTLALLGFVRMQQTTRGGGFNQVSVTADGWVWLKSHPHVGG